MPQIPWEYHRKAIGVGKFTVMAVRQLHRVVNLVEPEEAEIAKAHKAEMRRRMYQALDSDPELRALRDWYLSRSCTVWEVRDGFVRKGTLRTKKLREIKHNLEVFNYHYALFSKF